MIPTSATEQVGMDRPPVNRRDVVAGAIVTIAGAALFADALAIEVPSAGNQQIGPNAFPLAISALMTILGTLLAGSGFLRPATANPPGTDADGSLDESVQRVAEEIGDLMDEPPVPLGRLLLVLAIFVAYLVALIPIGFLLSTAVFMFAMTTLVAPDKRIRNALVAVTTSAAVYFCFSSLLGVELPFGVLGW